LPKKKTAEKVPEKCPKHPRYQAKRKPTSKCRVCLAIWKDKQGKAVKLPRTAEEKDQTLAKEIRAVIRHHRLACQAKMTIAAQKHGSSPLSESITPVSDTPRVSKEVQDKMTADECCAILRAMAEHDPNQVISRNYFRCHSGIKESTWNGHFGKFEQMKRAAGIILNRGAHRLELAISKHQSADIYRTIAEERRSYGSRYLKEPSSRFTTILAFADVHDVDCDPFALRVLLDVAKRLSHVIDTCVIGGDAFDLPEFGRFTQDPRDWDVSGRIKFVHGNLFSPLRESLPNSQIDFVEGNHEARLLRHLGDATPALKAVLSDLHGFTVAKLLGLDEFEINYVANGDLAARSWSEAEHKREVARNWRVYHDCVLAHHFAEGRQKGYPGFHGHSHKHRVWSADSPMFGAYEWHQLGALHVRQASYTDGERWNNGFTLIHVDRATKAVQFEYITVGPTFSLAAGKFYERRPEEEILTGDVKLS
jgi:hypothetical protein